MYICSPNHVKNDVCRIQHHGQRFGRNLTQHKRLQGQDVNCNNMAYDHKARSLVSKARSRVSFTFILISSPLYTLPCRDLFEAKHNKGISFCTLREREDWNHPQDATILLILQSYPLFHRTWSLHSLSFKLMSFVLFPSSLNKVRCSG